MDIRKKLRETYLKPEIGDFFIVAFEILNEEHHSKAYENFIDHSSMDNIIEILGWEEYSNSVRISIGDSIDCDDLDTVIKNFQENPAGLPRGVSLVPELNRSFMGNECNWGFKKEIIQEMECYD